MSGRLRVVVAEDHAVVRQGVCALLSALPDIEVVAQVGDGLAAIEAAVSTEARVLLLDLMMPGPSGFDVIRQLARQAPRCRVLVLSMHDRAAYVAEALRSGAAGYVLKASDSTSLLQGIRAIADGGCYLSPSISDGDLELYCQDSSEGDFDPYDTLTERERQVMAMVAQGRTNPAIATYLSISPRTVEIHRGNLMRKLGIKNQSELIRYALKKGVIALDSQPKLPPPRRSRESG